MQKTALTFGQLADWFDMRAEREREVAEALRIGGNSRHHRAAEICSARAGIWDEAAANAREAARKIKERPE